MNRDQFLSLVRAYIESDPEAAPHVATHVQAGLSAVLAETRQRAADMEAALALSLANRRGPFGPSTREYLERWKGKTALSWDWLLAKDEGPA